MDRGHECINAAVVSGRYSAPALAALRTSFQSDNIFYTNASCQVALISGSSFDESRPWILRSARYCLILLLLHARIFRHLGAHLDNTYMMIDSTIVHTHQLSAGGLKNGARIRPSSDPVAD